jgi:hypothetical protein
MSVLIRTVVALPLLVFFSITAWFGWVFLDPMVAAFDDAATGGYGMMEAIYLLISIGFRFVFPGLAVVVVGWWVFGTIRVDARFDQRRPR